MDADFSHSSSQQLEPSPCEKKDTFREAVKDREVIMED